jgi:hypothetical protein
MGEGSEISVLGFDPKAKVYTYESFSSQGEHEIATGKVEGDTWTWNSVDSGQPFKWRYSQKILSNTSFSSKFELSMDGSTWTTVMESKSVKK